MTPTETPESRFHPGTHPDTPATPVEAAHGATRGQDAGAVGDRSVLADELTPAQLLAAESWLREGHRTREAIRRVLVEYDRRADEIEQLRAQVAAVRTWCDVADQRPNRPGTLHTSTIRRVMDAALAQIAEATT